MYGYLMATLKKLKEMSLSFLATRDPKSYTYDPVHIYCTVSLELSGSTEWRINGCWKQETSLRVVIFFPAED